MAKNLKQTIILLFLFLGTLSAEVTTEETVLKPSEFLDFDYQNSRILISGEKSQITVKFNPQNPEEFILIRAGIKDWGSSSNSVIGQYSILNNNYPTCKGENLPFTNFTIKNNQITLNEKFRVFNECLSFKIEDPGGLGIEIPEEKTQTCKFKKINENLFFASVGDCFLKPKPGQTITVSFEPNPNCHDRKFLVEKNISPTEIMGTLQAYGYPTPYMGGWFEANGKLDERTTFLNINPGSEFFNLIPIDIDSAVEGKTIYKPSTLLFPQMTISGLEMQYFGRALIVNLNLLLSTNNNKIICPSNLCSIQSNFDIPLVAEVFLYRYYPNGKKEEIKSILIGDRIPNRWNGDFFSNFILKNADLEAGENYSLEFSFFDPYLGYKQLKNSVKSLFSLRRGSGSIGTIGSMSGISTIDGLGVEGFGSLPNLGAGSIRGGFPRMNISLKLPRLSQSMNDQTFPVEYKEICNQDLSVCEKISSKEFARMVAKFKVESIDENSVNFGKKLSISWKTNLWSIPSYELDLANKAPRINCGE